MAQGASGGKAAKKPLYRSLYFQVIVAIVIGILLGHFYPETGTAMKPFGDGFIKLIKMTRDNEDRSAEFFNKIGHDRTSASLAYFALERTLFLQSGQAVGNMCMYMCANGVSR
jgi:hypothetical protein